MRSELGYPILDLLRSSISPGGVFTFANLQYIFPPYFAYIVHEAKRYFRRPGSFDV